MANDKKLSKIPVKYRAFVKKEISNLVDYLQKRRQEKGLSQTQFSEEINIAFKTLQAIEQGTRKPSLEVLLAMCRALGVKLELK